jgi:hypothetical protein
MKRPSQDNAKEIAKKLFWGWGNNHPEGTRTLTSHLLLYSSILLPDPNWATLPTFLAM